MRVLNGALAHLSLCSFACRRCMAVYAVGESLTARFKLHACSAARSAATVRKSDHVPACLLCLRTYNAITGSDIVFPQTGLKELVYALCTGLKELCRPCNSSYWMPWGASAWIVSHHVAAGNETADKD